MPLLTLRRVQLTQGHPPLLDGIDLALEPGERVGLVGRNGCGKSTLLRLIEGTLLPDDGEIARGDGLRTALLAQDVPLDTRGSVFHVVAGGLGDLGALIDEYHRLAVAAADGPAPDLAALERCQQALEARGGWQVEQRVEQVISRLALPADAAVDTLSGGLRRRVMLARALVSEPDLLLLDEPTNHLDIDSIRWLEDFLREWRGTLLFVTHDREFLQALATRIVEIDRGQLTSHPGDYATYMARREAALADERRHDAEFDRKLAQEETWIRQGIKARRTRNEGRVRALERLRVERAARRSVQGQARLVVQEAERSGRLVVEACGAGFDYDGRPVIRQLDTTLIRGDKVGIIGPNGAGKTTLLRLLLGELAPTTGTIRHGTGLQVAYFDQYRAALDPERSAQHNVADGRDMLTINGQQRHVLGYLQDFLFTPDRARQPVRSLSGGERNRLLLARLFTQPCNVLVLDEPTNDLDIDTLELLEERLVDYAGTVLLVSHDRSFLDRVVTSTLAFEDGPNVREYVGGYADWLRQRRPPEPPASAVTSGRAPAPARERDPVRVKRSYKDQRELEALPLHIEALEAERGGLLARMAEGDFYRQDKATITAAQARAAELDTLLAAAYRRWEELESGPAG